jgi:hypothetical protein
MCAAPTAAAAAAAAAAPRGARLGRLPGAAALLLLLALAPRAADAAIEGQATWYPSIYQGSCGFFDRVPVYVGALGARGAQGPGARRALGRARPGALALAAPRARV